MMDPVVTVDADSVSVEPGGQASVTVRVRNLSAIVEGFRLDVLGEASGWARVLPEQLEILPQGEGLATVLFQPPSGVTTRAGQVPFGVRATSKVDAAASAVAEGDLQVGNVALSQAKLTPVTSKGRFSARHRVEFSNWGNTPVRLKLEASDPDQALGFLLAPELLDLPLGTTRSAKIKVRARKPFLRGTPQRRQFRVVGRPVGPGMLEPAPGPNPQAYAYDPSTPGVDGAFEQKAIIGRGLLPLAVLAIAAAATIGYLTSRPEKDPADEVVAPPAPQNFVAETASNDTVTLTWTAGDRVDGYKLQTIDPATAQQPRPTVTATEDLDADIGKKDVADLAPGTQNCFRLVAVRGDAESAPTQPQCVVLPAADQPGAPPVPTDVNADVSGEKALITWAPDDATAHRVRRGTTIVAEVAAPVSQAEVSIVANDLCYQVLAVGETEELLSDWSEETCLPPGSGQTGGPNGTGGGQTADLKIVAVPEPRGYPPFDDPHGEDNAKAYVQELQAQGIPAAYLLTTQYPSLLPPLNATWLVYIPGFTSEAQGISYCQSKGLTCATYTPGRRQVSSAPGDAAPTATSTP
jgi:Fibronectin type III domain